MLPTKDGVTVVSAGRSELPNYVARAVLAALGSEDLVEQVYTQQRTPSKDTVANTQNWN